MRVIDRANSKNLCCSPPTAPLQPSKLLKYELAFSKKTKIYYLLKVASNGSEFGSTEIVFLNYEWDFVSYRNGFVSQESDFASLIGIFMPKDF